MSDLDDDDGFDRSLLDAARPGLEPSAAQRKKLRRAVLGALATSAVTTGTAAGAQAATATGVATAAGTATGGVATAAGLGLGAKIVIGTIALASVVGVVAVGRRSASRDDAPDAVVSGHTVADPVAPATSSAEPTSPPGLATPRIEDIEDEATDGLAPPVEAPVDTAPPVAPEAVALEAVAPEAVAPGPAPTLAPRAAATRIAAPDPAAPEVETPAVEAVAPAAPPEEDPMRVEMRLLAQARAAIARHDGAAALAVLDEHARRFPDGQLREERLANRVSALCALGERERAHAEATAFLAAHPGSVQAGAVRDADCWSDAHELATP